MTAQNRHEVPIKYRTRLAVVYCRQSTTDQVENNTGSTENQRAQKDLALAFGWSEDMIEVNEEDLGLTGAAADHRRGYQGLKRRILRNLIAAVFVVELTRLSRDPLELIDFLRLCDRYDVLVFVGGKLSGIRDETDELTSGILAFTGHYETRVLRRRMQNGVLGRLRAGFSVTAPPAGFVKEKKGQWIIDPDPAVQGAIRALFAAFREHGTCPQTVAALRAAGIRLPVREGSTLRWVEPTVPRVRQILRNRRYTNDYIYREKVVDPRRGRDRIGHLRSRPADEEEIIEIENHHEGYISRHEWLRNLETLRSNAPSPSSRPPGAGSALLQARVRCGRHGTRSMSVAYKPARRDGGEPSHLYYCSGDHKTGGRQCGHFAGRPLDDAVVTELFKRLSPPSLAIVREEAEHARSDDALHEHQRITALNQARQRVAHLELRFLSVDPAHHLVKESLEARLEQEKRELKKLEQASHEGVRAVVPLDGDDFAELVRLCGAVQEIFYAKTTTARDRKSIIGSLIDHIVVESRNPEAIAARIVWKDGAPDLHPRGTPKTGQ